jgi:4-alpha-glucanotransferase
LWQAFVQAGSAVGPSPSEDDAQSFLDAALAFTAATPSPLCLAPLEDIMGIKEQPNLPGTVDEHPNWRRRMKSETSVLLDEMHAARRIEHLATRRPRL